MSNATITPAEVQELKVSNGALVRKANKYRVSSKSDRTYNGVVYDSKREMQFAQELDTRKAAGEVWAWTRQVPFTITVNGQKICDVIIDFKVSIRVPTGLYTCSVETVLYEVKGVETPVWRLKRKLLMALYPNLRLEIVR